MTDMGAHTLKIRRGLLFFGLLYLSLYVPLTFLVYLPGWYELNCNWHSRCDIIGMERTERAITELTRYFRHQGELDEAWSKKERMHLAEVRPIYDCLLFGSSFALLALGIGWNRRYASRTALWVAGSIAALTLVLPFFATFWTQIFHGLLFDNDLWRNNRGDLSWYFMPRQLFMYSVILLIAAAVTANLLVAWFARNRKQ